MKGELPEQSLSPEKTPPSRDLLSQVFTSLSPLPNPRSLSLIVIPNETNQHHGL